MGQSLRRKAMGCIDWGANIDMGCRFRGANIEMACRYGVIMQIWGADMGW